MEPVGIKTFYQLPVATTQEDLIAGDVDVAIVGVDQAESAATVQPYVDDLGLTFTIPMDTDGAVGQRPPGDPARARGAWSGKRSTPAR